MELLILPKNDVIEYNGKTERKKKKSEKNWTVKINHGSEIPSETAVFSYKSHLPD